MYKMNDVLLTKVLGDTSNVIGVIFVSGIHTKFSLRCTVAECIWTDVRKTYVAAQTSGVTHAGKHQYGSNYRVVGPLKYSHFNK